MHFSFNWKGKFYWIGLRAFTNTLQIQFHSSLWLRNECDQYVQWASLKETSSKTQWKVCLSPNKNLYVVCLWRMASARVGQQMAVLTKPWWQLHQLQCSQCHPSVVNNYLIIHLHNRNYIPSYSGRSLVHRPCPGSVRIQCSWGMSVDSREHFLVF